MWTVVLRIIEIVFVLAGGIASIWASRLWLQAQKQRFVVEAQEKVIDVLTNSSDAWKSRYEAEHLEHTEYRERQHARNNESNATILQLTDENSGLKAKTDLSPVMETLTSFIEGQQLFVREQSEINNKILSALTNLEKRINGRKKLKNES